MVSTGGAVSTIRKEVSLSRSHSDSYRRNQPCPGTDVVRQFASSDELEKLQVHWLFYCVWICFEQISYHWQCLLRTLFRLPSSHIFQSLVYLPCMPCSYCRHVYIVCVEWAVCAFILCVLLSYMFSYVCVLWCNDMYSCPAGSRYISIDYFEADSCAVLQYICL